MNSIISELLSWTHIVSATVSILLGAVVLIGSKGTPRHRRLGFWYVVSMYINNLTALFIVNAFGKWFFPHYLAIACLVVLIPAYIAPVLKFKYWMRWHLSCMVVSYYLLMGGALNEAFLHLPKLRPYILNNDPVLGISHMILQFAFLVLLVYFFRKSRHFGP